GSRREDGSAGGKRRQHHGRPTANTARMGDGIMTEWTGVESKRVVITGATSGIGLAAAEELARRGAKFSLVARSEARAAGAVSRIDAAGGTDVDVLLGDLAS